VPLNPPEPPALPVPPGLFVWSATWILHGWWWRWC